MYVQFNKKMNCWEAFQGDDKTVIPNWTPNDVAFKKKCEGHYNGVYYNVEKDFDEFIKNPKITTIKGDGNVKITSQNPNVYKCRDWLNWVPDGMGFSRNKDYDTFRNWYHKHMSEQLGLTKKKEEKMLNDEENSLILEKIKEDYQLGQSIVNDLVMSIAERGNELHKRLEEQQKLFDVIKKLDPKCDKCDCGCDE